MAFNNQFNLQTSGMQASLAFTTRLLSNMKIRSTPYGDERPKRKCYTCFDMDLRTGMPDFDQDGIVVHYVDFFEQLQTNTMKLVLQTFQDHFLEERSRKVAYVMLESRVPGGPLYVTWTNSHPINAEWGQIAIRLELYTIPGQPCLFKGIGPARSLAREASLNTMAMSVRNWLDNCNRYHRSCGSGIGALPTRVIDVGSASRRPRLYKSKGEPGRYVALSHCWGGGCDANTTKKNVAQREVFMSMTEIPKTFQHAIALTRACGLQYLWIDSLCIVQDDEEEWRFEVGRMCHIYSNCAFVIAADFAPNCNSGFLMESRWPEPFFWETSPGVKPAVPTRHGIFCDQDFPMLCPNETNDGGTVVYLRLMQRNEPRRGEVGHKLYIFDETHTPTVLDKRGWCFQERLLAKRVLHVGQSELSWECVESTACECQSVPTGDAEFMRWKSELMNAPSAVIPQPSSTVTPQNRWIWTNIIGEFTRRHLTYSTDRLEAVAGIAMTMKSNAVADYVCGLWKSDMFEWLQWSVGWHNLNHWSEKPPSFTSERQPFYYAPTWSWASVTGPITYRTSTSSMLNQHGKIVYSVNKGESHWKEPIFGSSAKEVYRASIVSVESKPLNVENPYGRVQPFALLRMRGYLVERSWCIRQNLSGSVTWDIGGNKEDRSGPADQIWVFILLINIHQATERNKYKESIGCSALYLKKTSLGAYERVGIGGYTRVGDLYWERMFSTLEEQEIVLV